MDKATAIRAALNKLGERNFTAQTATHSPVMEEWKHALLTASAAHHWTFTRSVTTLQPISNTPPYIYHYPADCLSIIQLTDSANRRITWRPYSQNTILTINPSTITPTCIYNNNTLTCADTLPDSDPIFTDYFIALLASRIAPCILGGEQGISLSHTLLQEASLHLSEARTRDAQQYASNDDAHPLRTYLNLNSSVRL